MHIVFKALAETCKMWEFPLLEFIAKVGKALSLLLLRRIDCALSGSFFFSSPPKWFVIIRDRVAFRM